MKKDSDKDEIFRQSSPSIISQVFSGLYREFKTCQNHANAQKTFEFITCESLDLEVGTTLRKGLRAYFGISIEERRCKVCKKETDHKVYIEAHYFPPIMVI